MLVVSEACGRVESAGVAFTVVDQDKYSVTLRFELADLEGLADALEEAQHGWYDVEGCPSCDGDNEQIAALAAQLRVARDHLALIGRAVEAARREERDEGEDDEGELE